MQAIILAAGDSTRYEGNKLLTPFNGKLLVEYAIDFSIENDVSEIFITLSPHVLLVDNPIYQTIIKNYSESVNSRIKFKNQNQGQYGPAAAIKCWGDEISEDFIVLMGDNFIQGKLKLPPPIESYKHSGTTVTVGYLDLPENVDNLKFAVISEHTGKLIEKPHNIKSGKYFIGFAYFNQPEAMHKLTELKPSMRGELEITDFINLQDNIEIYDMLQLRWIDITFKYENPDVDNYIKSAVVKPKIFRFFDWDQTLVFTDQLLYDSYSAAMRDHGYDFSYDYFMNAIYADSTAFLRATGIKDQSIIDDIKEYKEKYYLEHLEDLGYAENLWDIINSSKIGEHNIIVTNTNAKLVYEILHQCQLNESGYIIDVIGSDTVSQRKPYPNLYLEAFEKISKVFNYEKDTLEIYEDSLDGLTASTAFLNELKNGYNGFKEIKNFKIIHV